MDKYDPQPIEQHWAEIWEQSGYFTPNGKGKKAYSIVIPPPNVTGSLHMGHGFQYALMDILIRYHRMRGYNTLWQVGMDHAGIATQMVVMQQLISQGKDPYKIGRAEFEALVWQWKEKASARIREQMRRTGISVDWQRERFTMDEGLSKAVHKVFIDLYDEGLIYRGKKLVNWDPILNTAVSDLEVIAQEQDGFLWYFRYPIEDSNEYLVVATTRPETMLGDTAIAVHPDDERYQNLIGKFVRVPLTERRIPIIADDYVELEFGTGCVKITPAHDFNDYQVGLRHGLPMINIFTPKAVLNENAPESYQGLDRFAAREKIVNDLKKANLLVKVEPHKLKVPVCDRSGAIVEPYLTDQWFVKVEPLAAVAKSVVEEGEIKFVPENWAKIYLGWLEHIEDWCISRQLWWGHRIPAWYDERHNIYVGENENEIRKKYKLKNNIKLTQESDVLDTWFSSALWPFSALGWPEKTSDFKTFYPTDVLVTGFDIIFFWVVRMAMMALKFTKKVPFKEVYITGLIRDSAGQKMSKSKGNILDPLDLVDGISLPELVKKRTSNLMQPNLAKKIEQDTRAEFPEGIKPHGMDALRFTFCALASTGRDINFDLNRLTGYRNFCNKIWNAARFVLLKCASRNLENRHPRAGGDLEKPCKHWIPACAGMTEKTLADKWILSRLHSVIHEIESHIRDYRFDLLAQVLHEFIWHEYCDWYLELCKVQQNIGHTMIEVLEILLRLIHPIMPFISEEIWQQVAPLTGKKGATIMLQPYPKFDKKKLNSEATYEIEWLKKIVISIRNIRGEMNIAPKKSVQLLLRKGSLEDKEYFINNKSCIIALAKIESISWLKDSDKIPASATALIDNLELHIPLADVLDVGLEKERLEKEIVKLQQEIERSEKKLANENYVQKAPQDIVEKEKVRLQENLNAVVKLQAQFDKL